MKKLLLAISVLTLSACSTTETVGELPLIPTDATPNEAVSYITATCAGFAKSGFKNGHGKELDIFNYCMNKAVEILQKSTAPVGLNYLNGVIYH